MSDPSEEDRRRDVSDEAAGERPSRRAGGSTFSVVGGGESRYPGPGARLGAPGAGAGGERDPLVVLPPPKDDAVRSRRRRRWGRLILVLLLVALGLYTAARTGWIDRGGEAARDVQEAVVGAFQTFSGGETPAVEPEAREAAAARAAAERRFRQMSDSLESALDGYETRRLDFDRNRIGCSALETGYREVDRHFVSLSVVMREGGSLLGATDRRRYDELTDRVDGVNRHFDATDCRTGGG